MRRFLILLGFAAIATGVQAQSSEDFRVERWDGGVLEADVRLALSRGGPGFGATGGLVTGRGVGGPGNLFGNPALLGLRGPGLIVGGRAPLANGSLGMGSRTLIGRADVAEATNEFLGRLGYTGSESPVYTDVRAVRAGQPGQIGSMAASHPIAPGVFLAAGFHRPVGAALSFRTAGGEVVLDAGRRSGAQTIDIDVLAQMSAAGRMSLQMDQAAAGLAVHLGSDDLGSWHLGGALMRSRVTAGLEWTVEPDLMIVLSGSQQYFFNHPEDPNLAAGETNALFWSARARYTGSGWGARGGLRFATPEEGLVLSVGGSWTDTMTLSDPRAAAESYLPLFVNLGGELDPGPHEDELLDVEALNLAKPNLTSRTTDSLGTDVVFRQPASLTVGMDLGLGPLTLTGNYVRYAGEMSVEAVYGSRAGEPKRFRVGKRPDYEIRAGIDLRLPDRVRGAGWLLLPLRIVFLDLDGLLFQAMAPISGYRDPHYRIAGGLLYGDGIVTGVERNVRSDLENALNGPVLSGLAMARRYTLLDRLDVGVTVAGLPDLVLRTSVTYRMP